MWREEAPIWIRDEQALGLIAGGVDLLLVETSFDMLEVKAALDGIRRAKEETDSSVAVQAQVFLDVTGKMLLGTESGCDRGWFCGQLQW